MKKIFALMLVISVASASSAFAIEVTYATGDVTVGGTTIKTSKNVYINYKSDNSTANTSTGYAAATYHNKGTKTYGSSSGDSKVYEKGNTAEAVPAAPVGTASANFSSWTAL